MVVLDSSASCVWVEPTQLSKHPIWSCHVLCTVWLTACTFGSESPKLDSSSDGSASSTSCTVVLLSEALCT